MKIPISSIVIGERQRAFTPEGVQGLVNSFSEVGQINPITLEAARTLGWTEIDATDRGEIDSVMHQKIELEEDIRRTDRTWQEKCLAVAKLHGLISMQKTSAGEEWTTKNMATFTGLSNSSVKYMLQVSWGLKALPKDEQLWACPNYFQAIELFRQRAEKEAQREMENRRKPVAQTSPVQNIPALHTDEAFTPVSNDYSIPQLPGQVLAPTLPLTLAQRAYKYNLSYEHLWNQQINISCDPDDPTRVFLSGYWFLGGGNISDFYGAYQVEYLKRIETMFGDVKGKQEFVHLFSGSIPPSPDYSVVGLPDANSKPDIECNAEQLSSYLGFNPTLIMADPPYSKQDSENYAHCMVNRAKVVEECAIVLKPGGYLIWLDQALPVFSNETLRLVGVISYIRSTANRFRCVVIFQKR
jgi:hypothetical protein